MSDVLLLTPPRRLRHIDEEAGENLGAGYVASALSRAGITVTLLDADIEGWNLSRCIKEVRQRPWKVLGLSAILPTMVKPALALAKQLDREGLVAIGGHTPSLAPEKILQSAPRVDVVVSGEGELTFVDTVKSYLESNPWEAIPGLVFRRDNTIHKTAQRPLVEDLDTLGFPDRTYLGRVLTRGGDALISSSRGCYNNCAFCSVSAFYRLSPGPKWRGRSPASVAEEMERLHKDYGVRQVRFSDDNFLGPGQKGRERAAALACELKKRNLPLRFEISVRANDVEEDLFGLLREAGLYRVFLGVEAGVEAALKRLNKNVSVEENRQAVNTLRRLDLEPYIGFILFDPDTTLNELLQNLAFLQEIRGPDGIVNSRLDLLNRLEVYEGTPVARLLETEGRLLGDYLDYHYRFKDKRVSLIYGLLHTIQRFLVPTRRLFNRTKRRIRGRNQVLEDR